MKKVWIALFGIVLILGCMRIEKVHNNIKDSVIRLHILANSNDYYDQKIKLEVRDFVLENYGASLSCNTKEEALNKIYANLPKLLKEIAEFSGQKVKIGISETDFPTKIYNGFSFPGGKYLALKIELGEGKGDNWWCVMYPPLCFEQSAFVSDSEKLKKILPEEEYKLITEKQGTTLYKFKAVELWNSIKNKF